MLLVAVACDPAPPLDAREPGALDPLALVLAPHRGEFALDERIRHLQDRVRNGEPSPARLEELGWLFLRAARASADPGLFALAEKCAEASDRHTPGRDDARLLRGHALHGLHRFREAEALASELVGTRGLSFDWALLGDTQLDRGKLDAAARSYQRMMDLRPDAQAYSRAGELRLRLGDVEGAAEMMAVAAGAIPPTERHDFAWVRARLAEVLFQLGHEHVAMQLLDEALAVAPASAEAAHWKGRILLARGDARAAAPWLSRALARSPLPRFSMALASAHRLLGDDAAAERVLARLQAQGAQVDPRGFAIAMATLGRVSEEVVALAEQELRVRADAYSFDAAAWVQAAVGNDEIADLHAQRALEKGVRDARVFLHAGAIAARRGAREEARALLEAAVALEHMLLPLERDELARQTQTWEQPIQQPTTERETS